MKTSSPSPFSKLSFTLDSSGPSVKNTGYTVPAVKQGVAQGTEGRGYHQYRGVFPLLLLSSQIFLCSGISPSFLNPQRVQQRCWWAQLWPGMGPFGSWLAMTVYNTGLTLTPFHKSPPTTQTLPHTAESSTLSIMWALKTQKVWKDVSTKETKGEILSVLSPSVQRMILVCRNEALEPEVYHQISLHKRINLYCYIQSN